MSEKHTETDYDKRPIDPDMDDPYTMRGKTPEQIYRDAKYFSKRFAQEVTENRKLKSELGETRETLDAIADIFGIGENARSHGTIIRNAENASRRSSCLGEVESYHSYRETDQDGTESDIELLNWGDSVESYKIQYESLMVNDVQNFAQLRAVAEGLARAVQMQEDDLTSLMDESAGVAGLHLNGDVAPWGDIDESGRYERFSNRYFARAALAAYEAWKGNHAVAVPVDVGTKIPMTADGFPIHLGNTLFTQDPDQSYSTDDTIIEIKVIALYDEVGFDCYNGTFTVGGADFESGNLDFYALRKNVPRDDLSDSSLPTPQAEQEQQDGGEAPATVYIQLDDDAEKEEYGSEKVDGTWCIDQIFPQDVAYVKLADVLPQLKWLKSMAKQKLTHEMDEETKDAADYEGAYELIVEEAREALAYFEAKHREVKL